MQLITVNYTSIKLKNMKTFVLEGKCPLIINQQTTKSPPQFNLKLFSITSLYLSCLLELSFLITTNKKCLHLEVYSFPSNSVSSSLYYLFPSIPEGLLKSYLFPALTFLTLPLTPNLDCLLSGDPDLLLPLGQSTLTHSFLTRMHVP